MKKLFSILFLLFFSILTVQANAVSSLKTETLITPQAKTATVDVKKQNLLIWWCLTFTDSVLIGYDMEGNAIYRVTVTRQCVWFPNEV